MSLPTNSVPDFEKYDFTVQNQQILSVAKDPKASDELRIQNALAAFAKNEASLKANPQRFAELKQFATAIESYANNHKIALSAQQEAILQNCKTAVKVAEKAQQAFSFNASGAAQAAVAQRDEEDSLLNDPTSFKQGLPTPQAHALLQKPGQWLLRWSKAAGGKMVITHNDSGTIKEVLAKGAQFDSKLQIVPQKNQAAKPASPPPSPRHQFATVAEARHEFAALEKIDLQDAAGMGRWKQFLRNTSPEAMITIEKQVESTLTEKIIKFCGSQTAEYCRVHPLCMHSLRSAEVASFFDKTLAGTWLLRLNKEGNGELYFKDQQGQIQKKGAEALDPLAILDGHPLHMNIFCQTIITKPSANGA